MGRKDGKTGNILYRIKRRTEVSEPILTLVFTLENLSAFPVFPGFCLFSG